jgi:DNA-binding transcriptional LysR family regulator
MDLAQLRSFRAIARLGSFRKAAAEFHLAQPSLSQQIRRLEAELGVVLFDRDRRPVGLTEPGQLLLARATTILRTVDETIAELRDFNAQHRGRVRVGAMQYLAHLELPYLLARFSQLYPNAELQLRVGTTGEVYDMLERNEIDLALIDIRPESPALPFAAYSLRPDRLVLITAPTDPLAERRRLAWPDLAEATFIMFGRGAVLLEACANAGFSPKTTLRTTDIATALALVAQGLGVALVPQTFANHEHDRVAAVPIADRSLRTNVVIAWDPHTYQSSTINAFKSLAVQMFNSRTQPPLRQV